MKNMPALTTENIEPVGLRLLIEPFKQAEETTAGLIQAEGDGHATPVYGTVLKAGEGCTFKPGDAVLFRRYAIDSLKAYTTDGDIEVYLLEQNEVIGIVRGEVVPRGKQSDVSQINEKIHADSGAKTKGPDADKGKDDDDKKRNG